MPTRQTTRCLFICWILFAVPSHSERRQQKGAITPPSEGATALTEERAWHAVLSNDHIQAINQAEQAVAGGFSNSRIYTVLGMASLALTHERDAEQYFRQAISLAAPDDEFKQSSRLELMRILADRFNRNNASIDRLAFVGLIKDFLNSTNGFWYREDQNDTPSNKPLGNPASDSKIRVASADDAYQKMRQWAVSMSDELRSIKGIWQPAAYVSVPGSRIHHPLGSCQGTYNISEGQNGGFRISFSQTPTHNEGELVCRLDGTVTANGNGGFVGDVTRTIMLVVNGFQGASQTLHIEFKLSDDLTMIEGTTIGGEIKGPTSKTKPDRFLADMLKLDSRPLGFLFRRVP